MLLGITSVIRDLFPNAILLHANSRQDCLRIIKNKKIGLMISDGTVDERPNLSMIRDLRALQPDIKVMMLVEGVRADHLRSLSRPGEIDVCIRKNAPIERIYEAILSVLAVAEA
ncbi:response regulator transcription factor [Taibaiella koreensis]|uniref:response regulator transcription factor n=1 Tax=Taibaiella koreensis TaxID=1268548 RepID=UPI0013C2A2D8|nr:response regulator transcription factor [Taibaiella koreensis]